MCVLMHKTTPILFEQDFLCKSSSIYSNQFKIRVVFSKMKIHLKCKGDNMQDIQRSITV